MRTNRSEDADRDGLFAGMSSCALDEPGRREQSDRYRRLAGAVTFLERAGKQLIVQFDERLDPGLLEQALAVERECCPFFLFHVARIERRLEVGVRQPEQLPALDVLEAAFGGV